MQTHRISCVYLLQLNPLASVHLYHTRPAEQNSDDARPIVAVAVEDARGRITWDNSADKDCRPAAVLTARQVHRIVCRSSFSTESFHMIEAVQNQPGILVALAG